MATFNIISGLSDPTFVVPMEMFQDAMDMVASMEASIPPYAPTMVAVPD